MAHRITLIPGDGIGPEVTAAVVQVLDRAGVDIEWEREEAGAAVAQRDGKPLPRRVLDSITRNRVALKGPIGTPVGSGFPSVNVAVRRSLDLYANLRPVRSLPGIESRYDNVDLIVVRENTEDLYSGLEHQVVPGDHPAIEYDERIVDAACMHLVIDPARFDVLLLPNLYGDIVSDLCAGLVGGLGLVPSANPGEDLAVFEAVHGTAPDIAGRQLANPIALLLSALLMLHYLDEDEQAARILAALERVLAAGETRTPDLGGSATTQEFADAISRQVDEAAARPLR